MGDISIHALREEVDFAKPPRRTQTSDFYPRPPRGGRLYKRSHILSKRQFLSTPSARRATVYRCSASCCWGNFYPRPPRGGRLLHPCPDTGPRHFYPRPPRGGRLVAQNKLCPGMVISIHALREEGDPDIREILYHQKNFYPRPPRGGRPDARKATPVCAAFLSTPSARRATTAYQDSAGSSTISIHALREEGDEPPRLDANPPPTISIHALREEGDFHQVRFR